MVEDESGGEPRHRYGMAEYEHELSLHLARAHELGARAQRSNDAVEEQLRQTRQIADALRDAVEE